MMKTLDPNGLEQHRQELPQLRILDVRTPGEFETSHIDGSLNLNVDDLEPYLDRLASLSGPVVLVCRSGARAKRAADLLSGRGFDHLFLLEGGMQAWEGAGKPVEKGQKSTLPLDRQMRILAGAIAFLGSSLALWVDSSFAAIPMFIGCGLMYAGVTDNCPVTVHLAKLPWNKSDHYDPEATIAKLAS